MRWINFLHFYQPPFQNPALLERVTRESYLWVVDTLLAHPEARMTINISGSLMEHLIQTKDGRKVLDHLKKLYQRKQIEIVGSAMYHPILPLIPEREAMRQIALNTEWLQKVFGHRFRPRGFYLPEMAYAPPLAKLLNDLDFEWLILDEISYQGKLRPKHLAQGAFIRGTQVRALFRNRMLSNTYPPKQFLTTGLIDSSKTVVTATDGELYGHHHKDEEKCLIQALEHPKLSTLTCSDYLQTLRPKSTISPVASSWESSESELKRRIPFALWNHPKNKTHQKLWKLITSISHFLEIQKQDENIEWASHHFDRGLSSCTQWWMSGLKVGAWGMISWNPDEISKGIDELMRAMRSLKGLKLNDRLKVEKMYIDLKYDIWERHWKEYWKSV